jgi:diguanylate cyclase (GGDEF)-like protein
MAFRSLETRIVVFFVILLVAVQGTAFVLISAANQNIAKREVSNQLDVGERVFRLLIEQNARQLTQAATVLAADFAFREAIGTRDTGTIVSVLGNHGSRIKANVVMLADLDNKLLADTLHPDRMDRPFPFVDLIAAANEKRQASAITIIDGAPYQVVVVPVLAPVPIAWLAMGFKIDDKLARELLALTSLQVTFLASAGASRWNVPASTLPDAARADLAARMADLPQTRLARSTMLMGSEDYETRILPLHRQGEPDIIVALQQSLKTALEPFNQLRNTLLLLAVVSIALSLGGSILLGRSLAQPINRLAVMARKIRDGDYSQVVDVQQKDQIGELASSFNHMREAISSREEKILRLAYQDTLTSLPNRALFNDRLEMALKAAARTKTPVTMLMMDLDRFKYVNDALGHPVGDMVLREVGARFKALLRTTDTVARLGGDEFAIILPNAGIEPAREIATTILHAFEKPIILDGQPLDVGSSIGIASYPEHASDPTALMRHADVAMYVAKRSNRGFAVYSEEFYQPRQDYLRLLGDLRTAIERDELILYFQPKVNLRTGKTTQVEALIRWVHPQRGFVPPIEFIPFAEHTGFIRTITRCVIQKAIRQCKTWKDQGIDIVISFNISSRDLVNPELPNLVENELMENGVESHRIAIEVTESGFMEEPGQALDILRRLDKLGVRLSIDDYGTGYSSLSYIKKLPVQELKIDQSFVKNMINDANDAIIVKSTIDLGHNMGLKVVAEGVEDVESLAMLKQLGCDHAQGYYMSKPLSAGDFETWLSNGNEFDTMKLLISAATARP